MAEADISTIYGCNLMEGKFVGLLMNGRTLCYNTEHLLLYWGTIVCVLVQLGKNWYPSNSPLRNCSLNLKVVLRACIHKVEIYIFFCVSDRLKNVGNVSSQIILRFHFGFLCFYSFPFSLSWGGSRIYEDNLLWLKRMATESSKLNQETDNRLIIVARDLFVSTVWKNR